MINYVCGFYFDHTMTRVVLICKLKPKWQAGKLNGIGGKIEDHETPLQAMRREFKEECGIDHEKWHDLVALTGIDWRVYFFYAIGKPDEFEYAETQEMEEVAKIDVDDLDKYPHISNLRWLIPMALHKLNFPEENISFFNPAGGITSSQYMLDPNLQASEVNEQATEQEAATESAAQDSAMEVQEEKE